MGSFGEKLWALVLIALISPSVAMSAPPIEPEGTHLFDLVRVLEEHDLNKPMLRSSTVSQYCRYDEGYPVSDSIVHGAVYSSGDGNMFVLHSDIIHNKDQTCGVQDSPLRHMAIYPSASFANKAAARVDEIDSVYAAFRANSFASSVYDQLVKEHARSGNVERFFVGHEPYDRACGGQLAWPAGTFFIFVDTELSFNDPKYGNITKSTVGLGIQTGMIAFKPTGIACLFKDELTPGVVNENNLPGKIRKNMELSEERAEMVDGEARLVKPNFERPKTNAEFMTNEKITFNSIVPLELPGSLFKDNLPRLTPVSIGMFASECGLNDQVLASRMFPLDVIPSLSQPPTAPPTGPTGTGSFSTRPQGPLPSGTEPSLDKEEAGTPPPTGLLSSAPPDFSGPPPTFATVEPLVSTNMQQSTIFIVMGTRPPVPVPGPETTARPDLQTTGAAQATDGSPMTFIPADITAASGTTPPQTQSANPTSLESLGSEPTQTTGLQEVGATILPPTQTAAGNTIASSAPEMGSGGATVAVPSTTFAQEGARTTGSRVLENPAEAERSSRPPTTASPDEETETATVAAPSATTAQSARTTGKRGLENLVEDERSSRPPTSASPDEETETVTVAAPPSTIAQEGARTTGSRSLEKPAEDDRSSRPPTTAFPDGVKGTATVAAPISTLSQEGARTTRSRGVQNPADAERSSRPPTTAFPGAITGTLAVTAPSSTLTEEARTPESTVLENSSAPVGQSTTLPSGTIETIDLGNNRPTTATITATTPSAPVGASTAKEFNIEDIVINVNGNDFGATNAPTTTEDIQALIGGIVIQAGNSNN